jgi:hypothetical protein
MVLPIGKEHLHEVIHEGCYFYPGLKIEATEQLEMLLLVKRLYDSSCE